MNPVRAELAEHFAGLSDAELEARASPGRLTELAQQVAEEELARRGLALPEPPAPPEPAPAEGGTRYVLVDRFFNTMDAQTLRARLEAEGIPVLLGNINHTQAFNLLAPALGGVRLEVPERHAAQARTLIAEYNAGKLALDPEPDPEPPADPEAILSTDRRRLKEVVIAGIVLFFATFALMAGLVQMMDEYREDGAWSAGLLWPLALPVPYFAAAILLALRSKWSLPLFALHLVATFVLYFAYAETLHALGTGFKTAAATGLILYYGIYQLGQGRLR